MKVEECKRQFRYLLILLVLLYCSVLQTRNLKQNELSYYGINNNNNNNNITAMNTSLSLNIIINLFDENISWLRSICSDLSNYNTSVYIYLQHPTRDYNMLRDYLHDSCKYSKVKIILNRNNKGREGLSWIKYIYHIGNTTSLGDINMFLQGSKEANINSIRRAISQITHEYYVNSSKSAILPLHKLYCNDTVRRKFSRFMKINSFKDGLQAWNKIIMDYKSKKVNELSLNEQNICFFYRGEFVASRLSISNVRMIYGDLLYNHIRYNLEQDNNPVLGHVLERMWWLIFTRAKEKCLCC